MSTLRKLRRAGQSNIIKRIKKNVKQTTGKRAGKILMMKNPKPSS
jgi:hypothetical protein